MTTPALHKTWQGGSSLGGAEFVNTVVTGITPRASLWALHKAMTGMFSVPWTVVGSSDSVSVSMAGVDFLVSPTDWQPYAGSSLRSWLLLQQAAISPTFQILIALPASDAHLASIDIWCNAGGFGLANGGVDGTTASFPTAGDPAQTFNIDGTSWLGAEGAASTQKALTCISSTDGTCFRAIASQQSTGIPITSFGIERPRLPPPSWANPAVGYLFKSTVASGLSCFRWETMAATVTGSNMRANVDRLDATGFNPVTMVPMMPMFSSTEVVDFQEDDRPNPMLYPPHLYGTDVNDPGSVERSYGTLFDWYWCSRNVAGKHLLDLDTVPLGVPQAVLFPDDTADTPISHLIIADADQTGMNAEDQTVEVWLYMLSVASGGFLQQIVHRKNASNQFNWGLGFASDGLHVHFRYTAGSSRNANWAHGQGSPIGSWHHLAATRDKATGTVKLFYDGVEGGSVVDDPGAALPIGAADVVLGGDGSHFTDFHGYMAEFRYWNAVRTPAEIAANYNVELVGNEANLQCYLPLMAGFSDKTVNSNDATPVAGSGTAAPILSAAVGTPFAVAVAPPRTFVCVGDPVIGWLDDSATDLSYT